MQRLDNINSQCKCLYHRIRARRCTVIYNEHLKPSGLRITQFHLLIQIETNPTATVHQIAFDLDMNYTTASRGLTLLWKKGLIEQIKTKDRRTTLYGLTAKGKRLITEALPLWEEAQENVYTYSAMEKVK